MKFDRETCRDLDRSLSLEWLETNGRGGFSSGTVAGPNTRRYHALLLIARNPPVDRFVLVNHLEEQIEIKGQPVSLSANCYPGAVHPDGYKRCTGFTADPWPTWTYEVDGVPITREIFCPRGRDMVVVRWGLAKAGGPGATLLVRPMLSGRDYHSTHHENYSLQPGASINGQVIWQPYGGLPAVTALFRGKYRHSPDWYRRLQFWVEQERGLDGEEDWWSPGELTMELTAGRPAHLVLTTEMLEAVDVEALAREERDRRDRLGEGAPGHDGLVRSLWQAAEAYLSDRGRQKTVIAGYPWFADWGRDTFISLPGLCLVTGRHEIARQVIEAFAAHVSQGMIPNRFPDAGETPEYNTIDASLWFVHTVGRYLDYTKDEDTVRRVAWPAVRAIIDGYRQGTRYGIRMDADGLIAGGVPGLQLTWMDAKVGDWVVTPRHGKPVEIQALWVRALAVAEDLAVRFGEKSLAKRCDGDRIKAIKSFRARFWFEQGGYLYDVVDGAGGPDASLRPNQIYAVAFPGELLEDKQAKRVVEVVRKRLLTPVGLRTLASGESNYRPRYEGGVESRDGAYHQGTVWPFLLGPFVTAWMRVQGKTAAARRQARGFLDGLEAHLQDACVGQVSEIFDADAPHRPRGCFAQAWSVAEPLRALIEDVGVQEPSGKEARPSAAAATPAKTPKKNPRSSSR
jgi:predicted glycogen debranching enzyme